MIADGDRHSTAYISKYVALLLFKFWCKKKKKIV